ncbi:MAG: ParB/RepB/Spo0J family partition protein [Planctomycetota bacterium]|nr:ParB/RepB/Spo0J family partition protein [Planctomycetota bacterium]
MVDRRLGRGLDFFLSGGRGQAQVPAPSVPSEAESLHVEVGLLGPNPFQPRRDISDADVAELAASIRTSGILQPILARRVGDRFEIVAGERRWRAAKAAGLERVPVLVKKVSDDESAVFALVENIQREDLNAIEKARGFQRLMQKLATTQEEVAKRVGMDRSTIANLMRLLDLPGETQAYVSRGTLSMGHARALLGLVNREAIQPLAEATIRGSWSVRRLEQNVKDANLALSAPGKAKGSRTRPVWLNELEESLVDVLATPVSIRYGRKRSQIIIECAGREEFERVFQKLKSL